MGSVLHPLTRQEKSLPKTLQSIFSQTPSPSEVVVVDPGSAETWPADIHSEHDIYIYILLINKKRYPHLPKLFIACEATISHKIWLVTMSCQQVSWMIRRDHWMSYRHHIGIHKLQLRRRIGPQKLRPNVAPKSWPLHVAVLCR
jgi:hypothetical protein